MNARISRMVLVPLDGSENSLKAIDYLTTVYRPDHMIQIQLFYVLPALPPILVEESRKVPETARKLKEIDQKNEQMAERILAEAKNRLLEKGFVPDMIHTSHQKHRTSIAHEICRTAEGRRADAIVLCTHGRSKLLTFFMGETANKVLESRRDCPVWLIKGAVKNNSVLLGLDPSENSLRAVDHAGFMLSGTDSRITLFHTKRHLRRFVPQEVFQAVPELESLWASAAGREITPLIDKARAMLVKAGLDNAQIAAKIIDGSRSAAGDILQEARQGGYGTIVIGRRGATDSSDFSMGSIAKKIIENASDHAVWMIG